MILNLMSAFTFGSEMQEAALLKYIVDTNVLIDYPDFFSYLSHVEVIVPSIVIDELNHIKDNRHSPVSAALAQEALQSLERLAGIGDLHSGVYLQESELLVRVEECPFASEEVLSGNFCDKQILEVALAMCEEGTDVTLVTNDLGLRVRASGKGVPSTKFPMPGTQLATLEARTIFLEASTISRLYEAGEISVDNNIWDLYPNEYFVIKDINGSSTSALARYDSKRNVIMLTEPTSVWDVSPKNRAQIWALDALGRPDIPVVIFTGCAGGGKTFLSLAMAFEQTLNAGRYKKILLLKGSHMNSLGYLPGSKEDKILPILDNFIDNAEYLLEDRATFLMYLEKGLIELDTIDFIRGRSLRNTFIIVDEAQNYSKQQITVILSRVGEGSKIVLTGDLSQIDNHRLNAHTSGLSYLVEKAKSTPLVAHVHFTDGRPRSEVAAWASVNL